jgi:RimJ/RimL family protein N-acetyltransferase
MKKTSDVDSAPSPPSRIASSTGRCNADRQSEESKEESSFCEQKEAKKLHPLECARPPQPRRRKANGVFWFFFSKKNACLAAAMNPYRDLRTGRLVLTPVAWADLADLRALKGDPRVHAIMLGGVRSGPQVAEDLAEDIMFWGRHGVGMWAMRLAGSGDFVGTVGLHERPDGRGIALRFVVTAAAQGRGYASEAAGAALRFAHERAGLEVVIAVVRESNIASRQVLGAIGMRECDAFLRDGGRVLVYESRVIRR